MLLLVLGWYAFAVAFGGHLVLSWEALADTWRVRSPVALGTALGLVLAGYFAAGFLLSDVFGRVRLAGRLELPNGALFVALVLSTGVLAVARIAQVHRRLVWPALREGLRASWRQSRRAWRVNVALTVPVLLAMQFVVPWCERAFKNFGGTLPAPTQMVIDDYNFLASYILLVPFMLAALHILYVWWEGLTRAGARRDPNIRLFRWAVWVVLALYPAFAAGALYLPQYAMTRSIN